MTRHSTQNMRNRIKHGHDASLDLENPNAPSISEFHSKPSQPRSWRKLAAFAVGFGATLLIVTLLGCGVGSTTLRRRMSAFDTLLVRYTSSAGEGGLSQSQADSLLEEIRTIHKLELAGLKGQLEEAQLALSEPEARSAHESKPVQEEYESWFDGAAEPLEALEKAITGAPKELKLTTVPKQLTERLRELGEALEETKKNNDLQEQLDQTKTATTFFESFEAALDTLGLRTLFNKDAYTCAGYIEQLRLEVAKAEFERNQLRDQSAKLEVYKQALGICGVRIEGEAGQTHDVLAAAKKRMDELQEQLELSQEAEGRFDQDSEFANLHYLVENKNREHESKTKRVGESYQTLPEGTALAPNADLEKAQETIDNCMRIINELHLERGYYEDEEGVDQTKKEGLEALAHGCVDEPLLELLVDATRHLRVHAETGREAMKETLELRDELIKAQDYKYTLRDTLTDESILYDEDARTCGKSINKRISELILNQSHEHGSPRDASQAREEMEMMAEAEFHAITKLLEGTFLRTETYEELKDEESRNVRKINQILQDNAVGTDILEKLEKCGFPGDAKTVADVLGSFLMDAKLATPDFGTRRGNIEYIWILRKQIKKLQERNSRLARKTGSAQQTRHTRRKAC